MTKIKPRIFRGTRDFLPPDMIIRENIINQIKNTFSTCGFDPLETPAIEYQELLNGKYGEGEKLIYNLDYKTGTNESVALRYDLTVPLSRVVFMNRDMPVPFRRYQVQPVWRADTPQIKMGRLREFTQCDIDIVGSKGILADVEILSTINNALNKIGLSDKFLIRLNDRRILDKVLEIAEIPTELISETYRLIDKMDKISEEQFIAELQVAGLSEVKAIKLNKLLTATLLEDLLVKAPELKEIVTEMEEYISIMGVKNYAWDLRLARGMSYYTGMIFEIIVPELPGLGAISGGGRYDQLSKVFGIDTTPAVGGSIGLDRAISALEQLGLLKEQITKVKFLVINFGKQYLPKALEVVNMLRENNISVEFYNGEDKLKKQFSYADRKEIPYVLILGENELKANIFIVKKLATGLQTKINFIIKEMLITLYKEDGL